MTTDKTFVIVGASLAGAKAAETLRDGGLRRAPGADRRRARAPLRAAAAVQGLPARRGRAREGLRPRRGLLRRARHRAAARPHGGEPGHVDRRGGARRRRAAALRPAAARHRRRAAPALDPRRDARRRALPAQRRGLRRAARAAGPRRLGRRRRRRLDRRRGRRLRPAARPRRHRHRSRSRSRSSACSAPRSARSTATSTPTTACGCCSGPASRRSRAARRSSASAPATGGTLDCDFVVVGVGVQPRTELAAQAGLAVDDGILVDEHLQTSAPGVFAAGDVANAHHPFYGRADPRRALGQRAAPGAGRRPQHARPARGATTACRTSSPTSTTSAWSTRASPAPGTASSSAAIPRAASSSPSGWSTIACVAGMNVNVWDVTDHDPAAHPRRAWPSTTGASPTPTSRSRTSPPPRKRAPHEPPRAAARRRRLDLARHALARAARQRRVRDADRRLRGHRRDLEPDDLRQGDHRLRPLRRPAPRRRRLRDSRPAGAVLRARARRRPQRRRPAAPSLRGERRARRLRLVRVHARPRRRHRGDDRAGGRAVEPARAAERDDQGPRHRRRRPRDRGAHRARASTSTSRCSSPSRATSR